ncbi:MAG: polysaccharide biosynthesis protein PslF [Petroclostridium sp.]|uniref:glycosyltransferase family 4 protein n=1 Tax=Petroclostridium xylanilyticum TaxID=1792311 RepID=UPI000B993392|nr:glycosyltransferase family 4 protein [Petroclostridium xylanilyticum]MBZ4647100.1 glycosyl transferase group 1 [Clostridia bacterium]MDK2809418.1 polysaccharide biosynthesis protein PslF [Petroclostridium sp.]
MVTTNRKRNVAFLSTYPPRECGLATFTQDLINELDNVKLLNTPKIVAVSNDKYHYDEKVIVELDQFDRQNYIDLAEKLNQSDIDLLVIEHEYGIFGGECGEYLIDLVENLKIPFVTTLHTVLPHPNDKQRTILKILGEKSLKVITMARNTVDILKSVYEIDIGNIEVIHHGVPFRIMDSRDRLKERYGYKNRQIISTFGLISPGKGLEYGIEAIAKVVQDHEDILYLILGQTHPCVKKEHGESYREKLIHLVSELGLQGHVQFIDKYLTREEIIQYLQLSDIYMTPYLGKDQAVSGTLAYAVGYGRVIVSTPYSYAREMLEDGRGLLAEFRNSDSLAKCIRYILENPDKKKEMETKTTALGKSMMWNNVAKQYTKLFLDIIENNQSCKEQVV